MSHRPLKSASAARAAGPRVMTASSPNSANSEGKVRIVSPLGRCCYRWPGERSGSLCCFVLFRNLDSRRDLEANAKENWPEAGQRLERLIRFRAIYIRGMDPQLRIGKSAE